MEIQNRPKEGPQDSTVSCLRVSKERYTIISGDNTDAWVSSTDTVSLNENR